MSKAEVRNRRGWIRKNKREYKSEVFGKTFLADFEMFFRMDAKRDVMRVN